jgi:hypothetical protein
LGSITPPAPTRIVLRRSGERADHHGGRSAGDAGHVVVLGDPVAPIAQGFGMAGNELDRVPERVTRLLAFDDGNEVENGNGDHGDARNRPSNATPPSTAARMRN